VRSWHNMLRKCKRFTDHITSDILDLVDSRMLIKNPLERIQTEELCEQLDKILYQSMTDPFFQDPLSDLDQMKVPPPTDSGYASVMREKFQHTENARAEDYVQSTGDVQSRPPTDEECMSTMNTTSECAQNLKDLELDDIKTVYSDASTLSA